MHSILIYPNKAGSPSFFFFYGALQNTILLYYIFQKLYQQNHTVKCNTLLLHHLNIKAMLQKSDGRKQLCSWKLTACMLLCRVKIRNFLLTLVLGVYSIFGLLCWQVENISFTYWSIHVGKNGAQIYILKVFREIVSPGDILHNCYYCYWRLHMCVEEKVCPLR